MDLLKVVAEKAALKGTFIEDLFIVMQSGSIIDDLPPVQPGEQVVGKMNDLEKALNHLAEKYVQKEKAIVTRLDGDGEPFSSEEMVNMIKELERNRSRFKVAGALMWDNIRTRLADCDKPESTGWAIRKGYQIVLTFNDDHGGHGILAKMFGGAGKPRAIGIIID